MNRKHFLGLLLAIPAAIFGLKKREWKWSYRVTGDAAYDWRFLDAKCWTFEDGNPVTPQHFKVSNPEYRSIYLEPTFSEFTVAFPDRPIGIELPYYDRF